MQSGARELKRMNLLLLHGALGNKRQLSPLAALLPILRTRAVEFEGHGGRRIPAGGLSFDHFVHDIGMAMDEAGWRDAHLFGYSMGGYAALLFAAKHPERVKSVVTLGTKYLWTEEGLQRELRNLDPVKIAVKVPAFAKALAEAHGEDRWPDVVRAIAKSMAELARKPLLTPEVCARITCPVLLCVGEDDTTAIPQDTISFAQRLTRSVVQVLPGTKHPFDTVDLQLLLPHLRTFWGLEGEE